MPARSGKPKQVRPMTNTKLLDKLTALTKNADNADKEHIKKLHKVLKKLKKRQHKLADSLKEIDKHSDGDRQKIEQEISVLRLQRQKGSEVYKQLKKERKQRKEDKKKETVSTSL
jgi:putative component of toxin-antitoxin plasmid stabilization module